MAAQDPTAAQAATMFNHAQVGSMVGCTFNLHAGQPVISQAESRATTAEMIGWFSPINFRAIQSENVKKHTVGTGEWLLKDGDFLDWKAGGIKVFWITGMPGSGKTVLCAATNKVLNKEFEAQANVLFVMVFCRYDNKLTAAQIAAAITCQILDSTKDERVLSLIHDFYQKHKRQRTSPELEDFVELFEMVFALYDRVVTSIDAFDETSDDVRQELLEAFEQLGVSLFITSRPSINHFKDMLPEVHSLRLEDASTLAGDIAKFIRAKLSKNPRLMSIIKQRPEILEEACSKLVGKSKGMFMLAALHIASLQRVTDARQMMKLIDALPTELMAMYHHTWTRIKEQGTDSFELARRTFLWILYGTAVSNIVHTSFAANVHTLGQFLSISLAQQTYNPDSPPPRALIQAACEGLVDVDEQSSAVRLSHYTTKDFLESEAIHSQISHSPRAEIVASLIAAIRSWGALRPLVEWFGSDPAHLLDEEGCSLFIAYAHDLWPFQYADMTSSDRALTWEMLGCNAPLQPFSQYQLRIFDPTDPLGQSTIDIVGPAHIAAHYPNFGLQTIALEGFDTRSSLGFLPIHYLFLDNYTEDHNSYRLDLLVSMLEKGVDVNAAGYGGVTPLMLAAFGRDEATMSVLISHPDCDITKVDDQGRTALHWASMMAGAIPHPQQTSRRLQQALPPDLLLIQACGVNSVDLKGRTALHYIPEFAIQQATSSVEQPFWWTIIHHPDFDVNIQDKEGITPLMHVIDWWYTPFDAVQALLTKPGLLKINVQDKRGATALHHFFDRHWVWGTLDNPEHLILAEECLRRLLAHPDMDVTIKDNEGRSAFDVVAHLVAEGEWPGESESVIDMLKSHPSARRS